MAPGRSEHTPITRRWGPSSVVLCVACRWRQWCSSKPHPEAMEEHGEERNKASTKSSGRVRMKRKEKDHRPQQLLHSVRSLTLWCHRKEEESILLHCTDRSKRANRQQTSTATVNRREQPKKQRVSCPPPSFVSSCKSTAFPCQTRDAHAVPSTTPCSLLTSSPVLPRRTSSRLRHALARTHTQARPPEPNQHSANAVKRRQ